MLSSMILTRDAVRPYSGQLRTMAVVLSCPSAHLNNVATDRKSKVAVAMRRITRRANIAYPPERRIWFANLNAWKDLIWSSVGFSGLGLPERYRIQWKAVYKI